MPVPDRSSSALSVAIQPLNTRIQADVPLFRELTPKDAEHVRKMALTMTIAEFYALAAFLASVAERPQEDRPTAVHHHCRPSNLAGAPPFAEYCGLENEWPADAAGRQLYYRCIHCKQLITVQMSARADPPRQEEQIFRCDHGVSLAERCRICEAGSHPREE